MKLEKGCLLLKSTGRCSGFAMDDIEVYPLWNTAYDTGYAVDFTE
ncbi:MAG: hypothetical protein ACK2UO_02865 [Caldilineaceae bacterium]